MLNSSSHHVQLDLEPLILSKYTRYQQLSPQESERFLNYLMHLRNLVLQTQHKKYLKAKMKLDNKFFR